MPCSRPLWCCDIKALIMDVESELLHSILASACHPKDKLLYQLFIHEIFQCFHTQIYSGYYHCEPYVLTFLNWTFVNHYDITRGYDIAVGQ